MSRFRDIARMRLGVAVLVLMGVVSLAGAEPKATVELLAGSDAVAPGASVDVALAFRLADGWHMYWSHAGDAGRPAAVRWELPPGFQMGPLRFPGPKRRLDASGKLTTNILEGSPILTATLLAPATIDAKQVIIGADLEWVVGGEQRVRESASVRLLLPVVESQAEVKPANEGIFAVVRRTHPVPGDRGKYMTASARTTSTEVKPGDTFDLLIALAIKSGNHIQSHKPSIEGFIGTDVFVHEPDGLTFGDPVYPAPHERKDEILGKLSEYSGDVTVRIPVAVDGDFAGESADISGVVLYQACSEKSAQCYPPEYVSWSASVKVAGGRRAPAVRAEPDVMSSPETVPGGEAPDQVAETGQAWEEASDGDDALEGFLGRFGLAGVLVGCFVYGLFLNATPCVFPLLSIKVLGFVQQARESRRRTLVLGLAFGGGVVVFFVLLGFLAAAGKNVLQYPAAVIGLGAVVAALALSMLGVYTLQVPTAATKLEATIRKEGTLASFGKGALAPVLGFACTGPLLAGVFGWATQQDADVAVLSFVFAGAGMASPYMLLGANPHWLSFLPKPGPWMITFERIMGFLLLGMVIWLLHPLITLVGAGGFEWTLVFLVAIGMACWVLGRIDVTMSAARRWGYRGGAALIAVSSGALIYGWGWAPPTAQVSWGRWSPEAVETAVRSGKTVLVDFTAAYCSVCKANKRVAFDTPEVVDTIAALGVVPLQGDHTTGDERISAVLRKHNRTGVPLNLIYPAGRLDYPIVLRPSLTKRYLLEKLRQAGPSSADSPPPS